MNRRTIDPNADDVEALSELPGVGPVMAQRIIDARPSGHPEELTRVRGIGPSTLARLQSRMSFASTDQEDIDASAPGGSTEPVEAKAPETTATYEVPPSPEKAVCEPVEEEGESQSSLAAPEAVSGAEAISGPPFEAAGELEAPEEAAEPRLLEKEVEEAGLDEGETKEAQLVEEKVEEAQLAGEAVVWPSVSASRPARQGRVLWVAMGVGFGVLILSLVLSLGILASINGGRLQFASPADLAAMGVRVDGLEARASDLSQEIQGLRTRLDNVEAFGGRIDTLEGTAQGLRADLDDTTDQVGSLAGELDGLDGEISALSQDLADFRTAVSALESDVQALQSQNARTETFLGGLRDLLNQLFANEGGAQ
ncbi:MAG: helix-hairpin-helix domain-containing protein [Anaerolineae bacterium]